MKFIFTLMIFLLSFTEASTEEKYYELRVVEKLETYWVWHLETENGEETEERFEAIKVEVSHNNENIDSFYVYQEWFANPGIEFPEVGTVFNVPLFNYKVKKLGTDNNDMEIRDFNKLIQIH